MLSQTPATIEDTLRTEGGGAVLVPNAKALGLKPGICMDTGPGIYRVSIFHKLHCLERISTTSQDPP